ncbi:MAG: hypothetical protein PHI50_02445 [Alphaproteobacteria bacterium]|nr:hypothetical protein [Alphaproteobacteria bacterium]
MKLKKKLMMGVSLLTLGSVLFLTGCEYDILNIYMENNPPEENNSNTTDLDVKILLLKNAVSIETVYADKESIYHAIDRLAETIPGQELIMNATTNTQIRVRYLAGASQMTSGFEESHFVISLADNIAWQNQEERFPILLARGLREVEIYKDKFVDEGYPVYDDQTIENFDKLERAKKKVDTLEIVRELFYKHPTEFTYFQFDELGASFEDFSNYELRYRANYRGFLLDGLSEENAEKQGIIKTRAGEFKTQLQEDSYKPFTEDWDILNTPYNEQVLNVLSDFIRPMRPYISVQDISGANCLSKTLVRGKTPFSVLMQNQNQKG